MHRHLFGGGELHPLIRLAVNSSSAFSHDADVCTGEKKDKIFRWSCRQLWDEVRLAVGESGL